MWMESAVATTSSGHGPAVFWLERPLGAIENEGKPFLRIEKEIEEGIEKVWVET